MTIDRPGRNQARPDRDGKEIHTHTSTGGKQPVFGSLMRPSVLIAAGLVVAATVYAVVEGKFVILLIGAAMVATLVAAGSVTLERRQALLIESLGDLVDSRLGDAYDTGKEVRDRTIARQLAQLTRSRD